MKNEIKTIGFEKFQRLYGDCEIVVVIEKGVGEIEKAPEDVTLSDIVEVPTSEGFQRFEVVMDQ